MRRISFLITFYLSFVWLNLYAQNVAITDDDGYSADPSAMLDVKSIDKGILVPRLTTFQRTSVTSPADGLLVFDTDEGNFYFYNGTGWISLTSASNGIWEESASNVYLSDSGNKVGVGTANPFGKLEVIGDIPVTSEDPLFEVINSNGDTIFAVYSQGVRIYVDDNPGNKAQNSRGGFAVGGFSQVKGLTNEYLRVTPDSIRMYIDDNGGQKANGSRGGFAVGGFSQVKTVANDYFNISGADTTEVLNPSEARVVWYPQQEAFLAGRVLIESVDSVGLNSFATGYESKAIGNYSQALGYRNITRGDYSFSLGREAIAGRMGDSLCFAFGHQVEALNSYTFAMGMGAKATNNYSFAFGSGAQATGLGATAFGWVATASGAYSYASGYVTHASGGYSFAAGDRSNASGQKSFAFGTLTNSSGDYAFGFGAWVNSGGFLSFTAGQSINNFGDYTAAFGKGHIIPDTATYSLAVGFSNYMRGNYSTVSGFANTVDGDYSSAFGRSANVSGDYSFATGQSTIASGDFSFSGGYSSEASADKSFAYGDETTASGIGATAFGDATTASGTGATAFGINSVASGNYSLSFGYQNTASNTASIAGGYMCTASGDPSFAFGFQNQATGGRSSAFGHSNTASGWVSHSGGMSNTASGDFSTVFGQSNTAQTGWGLYIGRFAVTEGTQSTWVGTEPLFVAGNGTSDAARNNAMTLYKNGNLELDGSITQEPWQTPALQNSWENYSAQYNPAGYFRDKNGIVHLRGNVKNGTTINAVIFTLPSGYRPEYREIHTAISNGTCRIDVDVNGNVWVVSGGANNAVSLDGITFRAAGY